MSLRVTSRFQIKSADLPAHHKTGRRAGYNGLFDCKLLAARQTREGLDSAHGTAAEITEQLENKTSTKIAFTKVFVFPNRTDLPSK